MAVWIPHTYQQTAERFVYQQTIANPEGKGGAALFLDPGLGKTSIMLNAISSMREFGWIRRALIVAPLRVCHKVWPDEMRKWDNFRHLSHVVVCSPNAQVRKRRLSMPVDVHVINRDALSWLSRTFASAKRLPWDLIVIDESSGFRAWGSRRSKDLRKLVRRIPYRVILTGTPAPKSYADLFPQIWLLDEGKALGEDVTHFREQFCQEKHGFSGFGSFQVKQSMQQAMQAAIAPMCLRLDAKDYLSIPEITYHDIMVDLPPAARAQYDEIEEQLFLLLDSGERDIVNAAALYTALKQIASGGIYDNNRNAHELHGEKTQAVVSLLEELEGKPALIAYQYDHDLQRLRKAIRGLHAIRGGVSNQEFEGLIDGWNADTLDPPYIAVQPQALSYGVNMQEGSGRDVIWYGLTDNLDHYIQLNARIHRQGVGSAVRVHRVLAANTVDEVIRDRTDRKFDVQTNLLEVLREYQKQKG